MSDNVLVPRRDKVVVSPPLVALSPLSAISRKSLPPCHALKIVVYSPEMRLTGTSDGRTMRLS